MTQDDTMRTLLPLESDSAFCGQHCVSAAAHLQREKGHLFCTKGEKRGMKVPRGLQLLRSLFSASVGCLLLLLVLSANAAEVRADAPLSEMRMKLHEETDSCFAFDITRHSHEAGVTGMVHYRLWHPSGSTTATTVSKVTASVSGPSMVKLMDQPLAVTGKESQFSFQATMTATYRVCFRVSAPSTQSTVRRFVWLELAMEASNQKRDSVQPVGSRAASSVATAVPTPQVTSEEYHALLERLQTTIEVAVSETEHLQERNAEFDGTVRSTYTRIIVFTAINTAVVLCTCIWQVWSLKRLFVAKKVV